MTINSVFGWLIVGRATSATEKVKKKIVYCAIQPDLTAIWSLDTLGIREPNLTQEYEEQLALN